MKYLTSKIAMVMLWLFCSSNAAFAQVEEVHEFVERVSDQVVSIISSEAFSEKDKEAHLRTIFLKNVDTAWISRFVMGRYWREANATQRKDYRNYYEEYLLQSYIPKFREYTNQKLEIKRTIDQGDGEYLVETHIIGETPQPIRVDYKVRKTSDGQYIVFDMIAEGISLITTQRSEFGSILSRQGVDVLISKLKAKVENAS